MGTFSYFLGEIDIPEEDRAGYADSVSWITRLYLDEDTFTLKEANTP